MGRFHSLSTQTDQGAGRLLFAAARRLSFEPLEARQLLDAAALPVPLTPIEPLGSLAFETSAAASIDEPGQRDTLTIFLDGVETSGLSMALVMRSSSQLTGSITLEDPTGTILARATSDGPGQSVVLQRIATTIAGEYTVAVTGAEGTTGDFSVQLILGAAFEAEAEGGPTNDSAATAVILDEDFFSPNASSAERAVVVGELETEDNDWYRFRLDDGQSLTLALATDSASGATLDLYDASLRRLATGVARSAAASSIANFVDEGTDGDSDDYFVRISGEPTEYSLLVTRDLHFDLEPNDHPDGFVQDITLTGLALGAIDGAVGLAYMSGGVTPGAAEPIPDPVPLVDAVTFSVIGDYGTVTPPEAEVAAMIKLWDPQFIVTVGDNNYKNVGVGEARGWEDAVGQYYGQYILGRSDGLYPKQTSPTQRFFPSVGNHDDDETGSLAGYIDYFVTDPAGERLPSGGGVHEEFKSYYAFEQGNVGFFMVDSIFGGDSKAEQFEWLRQALAESTAQWKFVFMHFDPYSSGRHGSTSSVQWPFKQWGADAVVAGHDHNYERLEVGGLPYFVNGSGGRVMRAVGPPIPGSEVIYNDTQGAMRVTVDGLVARFEFLSLDDGASGANGGKLIDVLTIDKRQLDRYDVQVNAGDVLSVEVTAGQWRATGEVNPLDLAVELIDPAGRVVAVDDGGGPGLNARLLHTASQTGTYSVVVTAALDTAGEYLLRVEGQSAGAAPFAVRRSLPGSELPLRTPPGQVFVEFDNLLRLDTIQANDLTVDGQRAVALTILDGKSAVFDLAGEPGNGVHEVRIEAGRILDVQGVPIETYTGSFTVDTIPPTVVGVKVGSTRWREGFVRRLPGVETDPLEPFVSIPVDSGEQLVGLPWSGIDMIRITLSEVVLVQPGDLTLVGVNVGQPRLRGFFYNFADRSATWLLWHPLRSDKLLLNLNGFVRDAAGNTLDGNWTDGADRFPSGDGVAPNIEDFRFQINVLPGDVDGDGRITRSDLLATVFAMGTRAAEEGYLPRSDIDGDGQIDISDLRAVAARQGLRLPSGQPTPADARRRFRIGPGRRRIFYTAWRRQLALARGDTKWLDR